MSDEIVRIKGTKSGLQLLFAAGATYDEIEAEIRDKLAKGSGFFCRGTVMHAMEGSLEKDEMEQLRKLFHDAGVIFSVTRRHFGKETKQAKETRETAIEAKPVLAADAEPAEQPAADDEAMQMVIVNRTLRGGQEVRTKSSVLVVGNVNPGAQIIAGGSIDIRGTCRGMVHAGAFGNQNAFIVADHLMPTQIRIADLIARSPDTAPGDLEKTAKPERASIKDGQIVIEPIER
ncbi:septum site-determining protein MinC [Selenomonas sp.]|uniref:septum site-determining protein MinC n=1 Tax=Selenomonas sp. TaxID=2053611 RepID=UPI0025EC00BC|nr:septum site-determining protein MinC [Selenomonas sp.]MCI6085784.1 septum site-determining protein MinC [Selenomonas sp.]MDY3297926.1 septum site-determining protein MinC [Selenomonas sp.]MDY4415156.1 septum site-determining protein MinC [Selenomonas sp.]